MIFMFNKLFRIAAAIAVFIFLIACKRGNIQASEPPSRGDTIPPTLPPYQSQQKDVGVIFCNGFEDGNLNVWDDYDKNPAPYNVLLEHPGPFNKPGNHVMRLRADPGRGGADALKMLPGGPYDKIYARWYAYWEPGYDFKARNHGSGLGAGSRNYLGASDNRPKGNDFVASWIEPNPKKGGKLNLYTYYRGMYQNCANPAGSCWGDNFPCLSDDGKTFCTEALHRPATDKIPPDLKGGQWYCIEMMLDLGRPSTDGKNATGAVNFWIDGKEYGPWTNLWMRTTEDLKITSLWLNMFHHEAHSVEGMLFDDVVVSTRPIGVQDQGCK